MQIIDTLSIPKEETVTVVANWALVMTTMVLALITFFYMRHTRRLADETKRMANIMVREFELRVTPFLVIDPLSWTRSGDFKTYLPILTNRGFLSVRITKVILEWWYKKEPDKIHIFPQIFDKVLAKDESTRHGECRIPFNKGDMIKEHADGIKDLDFNQLLAMSEGNFYCIYEDITTKEQKKTGTLKHLDNL
jgi:hypothetical protein